MDVGYLLELERALQSHRIVEIAADEEHGVVVKVVGSIVLDIVGMLEYLLHLRRQAQKLIDHLGVLGCTYRAEDIGKVKAEHIQKHELGGVCLCRCDRYLGACPSVEHIVGFSCYGASHDIDYRQYVSAEALCLTQRRHRVKRLARLADDDDERRFVNERIAVAEFRRKADLNGLSEQALKVVLPDYTHMI